MPAPLVITPADPIISATDAKACVPALARADDDVVVAQIAVATVAAENWLEKAIGVQTLEWRPDECCYYRDCWPYALAFVLPRPPLISVETVTYLDTAGVEQTYDEANYVVSGVGGKGRITLLSGAVWPTLGAYPEPVRITYIAGYEEPPQPIIQAVLLDAAEAVAVTAESSVLSGAGTMRSLALDGVGTVTYAPPSASTSASTGAQSLSATSQRLLLPYKEF